MEIFQTYMQHTKHINIKINENGLRSLQAPCTQLQQGSAMAISTPSAPLPPQRVQGHGASCLSAQTELKFLMNTLQIGLNSSSKYGSTRAARRPLQLGVLGMLGGGEAP